MADYLAYLRLRGRSPATIRGARTCLYSAERSTGVPLPRWRQRDATAWWSGLAGHAPTSRAWHLTMLRGWVRWALRHEVIGRDPTVRLDPPSKPRRLPRPAGEPDLAVALAVTDGPVRVALLLAATAGLRRAEIADLTLGDVDHATGTLTVRRGKGGKDRIVPMPPKLAEAIEQLPRFPCGRLLGLTAAQLGLAVERELAAVGIGWRLHALRHRYGTRMYGQTRDLMLVGSLMGHASPQTTAGYVAITVDDRARTAAAAL